MVTGIARVIRSVETYLIGKELVSVTLNLIGIASRLSVLSQEDSPPDLLHYELSKAVSGKAPTSMTFFSYFRSNLMT